MLPATRRQHVHSWASVRAMTSEEMAALLQKAMPDQDIIEEVQFTKIAMQKAVEQMIVDVETNASTKTTNGFITGNGVDMAKMEYSADSVEALADSRNSGNSGTVAISSVRSTPRTWRRGGLQREPFSDRCSHRLEGHG